MLNVPVYMLLQGKPNLIVNLHTYFYQTEKSSGSR